MRSTVTPDAAGSRTVLSIEGRVATGDLPGLREALSSVVAAMTPSVDLVVDVSAVTELDELCAAVLRSAIVRARWNRNAVAVVAGAGPVATVVRRAVHAPGVGLFPDVDAAVRALDDHRATSAGRGASAVAGHGLPGHGIANPFRSNLS